VRFGALKLASAILHELLKAVGRAKFSKEKHDVLMAELADAVDSKQAPPSRKTQKNQANLKSSPIALQTLYKSQHLISASAT
jgi:hypothetical protein